MWAAGVTYATSRTARNEESGGHDFYDLVYDGRAARAVLQGRARAGCAGRADASACARTRAGTCRSPSWRWCLDATGEILGYTIGNDVSSRSIEGENPLYLPQAKVYRGSCALGPCIVPVAEAPAPEEMEITLRILRDGEEIFEGATQVALLRRTPEELAGWLFERRTSPRARSFSPAPRSSPRRSSRSAAATRSASPSPAWASS